MARYRKANAHRRGGRDDRSVLVPPTMRAPSIPKDVDWPDSVQAWWRGIWRTPAAGEWDRSVDLQTVKRLGDIYAALDRDATAALHAQAARLESELLLSPAARKRANFRLPAEEIAGPTVVPAEIPERWRISPGTGRAGDPTVGTAEDPRRVLEDWSATGG